MLNRREVAGAGGTLLALSALGGSAAAQTPVETVDVDLRRDAGALDHIWKHCVGSDRAEITMRESWRLDAKRGRQELGLERVRFHGIFDDELGVGASPCSAGPARTSTSRTSTPSMTDCWILASARLSR
ncbi:GH39 family glycosyl hydrolase [Phenylobacterium sp. LjRoot225]|uniref:GH39 family glycosyl hydrolase n=1 Tax=Phenylobacterium sp. LjRoot225 TaxID=3342285 RepID=UPI003F4FD5FC